MTQTVTSIPPPLQAPDRYSEKLKRCERFVTDSISPKLSRTMGIRA